MKRLLLAGVSLVVILGAVLGGTLLYEHFRGSVFDGSSTASKWPTTTADGFSIKVPGHPTRSTHTVGTSASTLFTLKAPDDSINISLFQGPQSGTVDQAVQAAATVTGLTVLSSAPTTLGGEPAKTYRLGGTIAGAKVTAFGAAVLHGNLAVSVQYNVTGTRTELPKRFQQVLDTITFDG